MSKTFEQYREEMYPCYKDYDAFQNKAEEICYIPENAESLKDAFTYLNLRDLVTKWVQNNPEYLIEHETNLDAILTNMFECLSWEFPSTFLDQLDY